MEVDALLFEAVELIGVLFLLPFEHCLSAHALQCGCQGEKRERERDISSAPHVDGTQETFVFLQHKKPDAHVSIERKRGRQAGSQSVRHPFTHSPLVLFSLRYSSAFFFSLSILPSINATFFSNISLF